MMHKISLALALATSAISAAAPTAQGFGDEIGIADPLPSLTSVLVLDANADGRLDVVTGGISGSGPDLFTSFAAGGRSFATAQPLRPDLNSSRIEDLASGDLDGDGDMDVAYASNDPVAYVGWYENLGDGFGPAQPLAMGVERASHIELCDIDGDQLLDVVWLPFGSDVLWRANLGGGVFGPTQTLTSGAQSYIDMEVVDLDGDNDLDVLAISRNDQRVNWWENQGGGNFASVAFLLGGLTLPEGMEAGDVDGDGAIDLVIADLGSTFSGERLVLAQNLLLGLPTVTLLGISDVHGFELTQAVGDGLPDLLLWAGQFEPLSVRQNNGGTFAAADVFEGALGGTRGFAATDMDGDGITDVVAAGITGASVWYGTGSTFGSRTPVTTTLADAFIPAVTAGDVDGDGLGDLAIAEASSNSQVGAMRNLGSGSWSAPYDLSFMTTPLQIELLDMDGDGDRDIVASGGSFDAFQAMVLWLENDGSGSFAPADILHNDLADSGATFSIGDREGDGDLDVFWTHRAGFTFDFRFAWSVQTSPGVFTPGQSLPSNSLSSEFRLADLDLDGDADIVEFATSFSTLLQWRENTGSGDFGAPNTLTPPAGVNRYTDLQIGDLDSDGRDDLVVASHSGVHWYPALAGGGFGAPQLIEQPTGQDTFLLLRDVNVDGRLDLFVSTQQTFANGLPSRWIENLGGGSFGMPTQLPEDAPGSAAIELADLDGDLDLDVLKRRRDGGLAWNRNLARFGEGYCGPAETNSTGEWGAMSASGSHEIAVNDLTLLAERLPTSSFGYFLVATEANFVPIVMGSQGNLCLGGPIGRLNRGPNEIFQTDASGRASVTLDVTDVPTPTGAVTLVPGDTRYVQAWYRDANPGATSNFTNGLVLTFE